MICCAALLHFLVFLLNPNLRIDLLSRSSWMTASIAHQSMVEHLQVDAIPQSPNLDSRPQVPRRAEVDLSEDVTIAETTFEANPLESIPAPPLQAVEPPPAFVPSYVGPEVLNAEQVLHRWREGYNLLNLASEAEGRVTLAFLISKTGEVIDYRVLQSSGNPLLDHVALSIKDIVWFSPAFEYGRRVDVWIRLSVSFAAIGG
jgi:TonB family protein